MKRRRRSFFRYDLLMLLVSLVCFTELYFYDYITCSHFLHIAALPVLMLLIKGLLKIGFFDVED